MDRIGVGELLRAAPPFVILVWIKQLLGKDDHFGVMLNHARHKMRTVRDGGRGAFRKRLPVRLELPHQILQEWVLRYSADDGVVHDRKMPMLEWDVMRVRDKALDVIDKRFEVALTLEVGVDVNTPASKQDLVAGDV